MDRQEGQAEKDEGDILANNPRAINVAEFAGARAAELKTMTEAIMTMGGMRRTFQKLPRHMRRRAMSHDLRRLPKRLRESEERTMQKCRHKKKSTQGKEGTTDEDPPPAKRSRRHRRRPGNLKQEYQRRQAGHAWLETHIWHAKRFKMVEQWGYKLPLRPSDKSVRATYRAMSKHCLLQDISYLRVIEMVGPQGLMLRALSHLTSPSTGLTCGAAAFLTGQRHGETVFYRKDQFPEGAIGPVQFLWKAEAISADSAPKVGGESPTAAEEKVSMGEKFEDGTMRQLWLWAHPSCSAQLLEELREVAETENTNGESSVTLRQLDDSPLRFRLQGPLAHPVLLHALKVSEVQGEVLDTQDRLWWEDYYANPSQLGAWEEQSSIWKTLGGVRAVTDLPPRCVLALTVRDPRNLLPIKKTKIVADPDDLAPTDQPSPEAVRCFPRTAPVSPLWEQSVRHSVASTQIPTHKLNKMRSELLVPGQEMSLGPRESRIPALLLQQPGIQSSNVGTATASCRTKRGGAAGFGSGWDVVLPKGWGMEFWIALVLRGCRAAGLQESRSCHLQQGVPHFPEGFPDTAAGVAWADKVEVELTKKFKRWPPAKRPNYGKLGVVSPFRCPWKKLVEEWKNVKKLEMEDDEEEVNLLTKAGKSQSFCVLRERFKLEKLSTALAAHERSRKIPKGAKGTLSATGESVLKSNITGAKRDSMVASNRHATPQGLHSESKESQTGHDQEKHQIVADLGQDADRMLVGVQLSMANRGVPLPFAIICLPSEEDLTSFQANQLYCPVEPIHKEFKLPKRSRKKKTKGKKGPNPKDNPREIKNDVKFEVAPDVKLLPSCRRRIIGFVVDGSNTFITGSGRAVGYCCMLGLLRLLEERPQGQRALVLVRDTKAVQYRFAFLDIIT